MFPKNSVIVSPKLQTLDNINYTIKEYGFNPVNINTASLYKLLELSGVETAVSKLGKKIEFNLEDDISKYPKLIEAIKIAESFEPGLKKMKLPIIVFASSTNNEVLGQTINLGGDDCQILIEKNHAINSDIASLIGTIIHEYDHYSSEVIDSDYRSFRDLADKRIGNLFYSLYNESIGEFHNGQIKFKTTDIVKLKTLNYIIEYCNAIGAHIAKFGELEYILNIPNRITQESGVLSITENCDELYVNINQQGTIERLRN